MDEVVLQRLAAAMQMHKPNNKFAEQEWAKAYADVTLAINTIDQWLAHR